MGMDTVELMVEIETTFKVEMPAEDLLGLMQDGDVRVGHLYGYILRQKGYRDTIRTSFGLNLAFWRRMRSILHQVTGRSTAEIQLATPLADLFPRGSRPDDWKHFREVSPWSIGSLDYSAALRYMSLTLALGLLALEVFQWRNLLSHGGLTIVLFALGILVFAESYAKVLWFLRPLRRTFPGKARTVKDLCRAVLTTNAVSIANEFPERDAHLSAEVWEQLLDIIVGITGIDRQEITFNSRMIRDLGFE